MDRYISATVWPVRCSIATTASLYLQMRCSSSSFCCKEKVVRTSIVRNDLIVWEDKDSMYKGRFIGGLNAQLPDSSPRYTDAIQKASAWNTWLLFGRDPTINKSRSSWFHWGWKNFLPTKESYKRNRNAAEVFIHHTFHDMLNEGLELMSFTPHKTELAVLAKGIEMASDDTGEPPCHISSSIWRHKKELGSPFGAHSVKQF